ncbi:TRAP transporter fused permease subunit [Desulfitobacterium hafniense]|uniref:TRAP transporter fused permease subunit n=1 Tax=Desulfitobacterium hafniense TaxID=49338 RepID=UPI00037BBA18
MGRSQSMTKDEKDLDPMDEKDLEALAEDGKRRPLTGGVALLVGALAVIWTLYTIYSTIFGVLNVLVYRGIHLTFALALGFVLFPPSKKLAGHKIAYAIDLLLALTSVALGIYVLNSAGSFADRIGIPNRADFIFGAIAVVLILELTRRVVGKSMTIVAGVFLVYALFGRHLPSFLAHPGVDVKMLTSTLLISLEGIFGVALGVSANLLLIFIVVAQFLVGTGTGQFIMDLSSSLIGWARGGPAKIAIISSGLFGSISGSAVANVLSTGAVTIPMMKKLGYKPHFAGAVEAAASTGGQIMPPVMGAAAFVMAEVLGVPYAKVCVSAALPAILYYVALLIMVDLEAARTQLRGIPKENLVPVKKTLKEGWFYIIPLVILIYLIMTGSSPQRAGVITIAASIIINLLNWKNRLSLKQYLHMLKEGSLGCILIAMACATAGIIMGCVNLTGLGPNFSGILVSLASGNQLALLLLTMVASIILGMALPTLICYMILAVLIAPALVSMGVEPMAAHLFVLYFGVISFVTPPVALAAYAGAAIANANAMKTGWTAAKIATCMFVLPFMFVYNPELILIHGLSWSVLPIIITSVIGTTAICMAIQGYAFTPIRHWPVRVILFLAGISLIYPGMYTDLLGIACFALIVGANYRFKQKDRVVLSE